MKISREEKLKEALKRMKQLNLHPNVLNELEKENKLNYSDRFGALYWIEDDVLLEKIKWFEDKYNTLVYHVIKTYTNIGTLYSFLYVSDNEDEWEMDKADLSLNSPYAYVFNYKDSFCSEIGSIEIRKIFGGLERVS